MHNKKFLITVSLIAAMMGYSSCLDGTGKEGNSKPLTQEEKVKRGEYLVNFIGCDDCHSPKKMGPNGPEIVAETRLSGYPSSRPIQKPDSNSVKAGWVLFGSDLTSSAGQWGMSFAANLTSDASGIGNWSEEQFVYAIRNGKLKGLENSRPILPPMPWFMYRNMTDDDLKSIFAYLKTVPPVINVVPGPKQISETP